MTAPISCLTRLSVLIVLRLVDIKERTNGIVDMTLTGTILNASYSTLGADDGFAAALILDLYCAPE
jgi:hypothetical protein